MTDSDSEKVSELVSQITSALTDSNAGIRESYAAVCGVLSCIIYTLYKNSDGGFDRQKMLEMTGQIVSFSLDNLEADDANVSVLH